MHTCHATRPPGNACKSARNAVARAALPGAGCNGKRGWGQYRAAGAGLSGSRKGNRPGARGTGPVLRRLACSAGAEPGSGGRAPPVAIDPGLPTHRTVQGRIRRVEAGDVEIRTVQKGGNREERVGPGVWASLAPQGKRENRTGMIGGAGSNGPVVLVSQIAPGRAAARRWGRGYSRLSMHGCDRAPIPAHGRSRQLLRRGSG